MMKRIILLSIICTIGVFTTNAQKFALIDMEYILENIPAYKQAVKELDQTSQKYQEQIDAKRKEAEVLYNAYYQMDASKMTPAQRAQKEEAIIAKEKEAADLRQKYFGPEGEMAKKQEALISPIQNRIYEIVKQISTQQEYDVVIDRASASSIIFASPRIDISSEVLDRLGYSN